MGLSSRTFRSRGSRPGLHSAAPPGLTANLDTSIPSSKDALDDDLDEGATMAAVFSVLILTAPPPTQSTEAGGP